MTSHYKFQTNIVDCNDVLPPENGSVAYPTGTTYDQTLEYSCDTGYDLIGPFNRTCLSDGIWDLSDPYCEIRGKTWNLSDPYCEIRGKT